MEKKLKSAIKALKKSINQERFLLRFSGMEYEVARKLSVAPERQESCGPGQQRLASKCGKERGGVQGDPAVTAPTASPTSPPALSQLLAGNLLPRADGAVRALPPRHLPGEGGAALL